MGVAGILGAAEDFDFEEGGAVAGTGDDFRTGGLFDVVGFAGEEAFVHAALAFDDDRVGWGDLIGEDQEMVADLDGVELEVLLFAVEKAVGEGAEGGGSAADGVALEDSSAEEHGDDDEGNDVLAGCDAGEDGDASEEG